MHLGSRASLPLPKSRLRAETQAFHRSANHVERFAPDEAAYDLPGRDTRRHEPENPGAAPGQPRLDEARRAQPCAQRLELLLVMPQHLFEGVPETRGMKRRNFRTLKA